MTGQGKRAVGTRISQEVYDVVLGQGRDYVGEAFVVDNIYITRYAPLRDHLGKVVGSRMSGRAHRPSARWWRPSTTGWR